MSSYLRRLPIYLLLDCSESMAGEAFTALKNGLATMMFELRKNPTALETAAISMITFASKAKQVIPLTDILKFQIPHMTLGSGTALGSALELWEQCMAREVIKTTSNQKGDYKPLCFILTDGEPTDAWENIADRVRTTIVGSKANVIAVACGADADVNKLYRITETVIALKQITPGTFANFFQWISASISVASAKLDTTGDKGLTLPTLPQECEVPPIGKQHDEIVSNRYLFLHSKCLTTQGFYLIRYAKFGAELKSNKNNQVVYKAITTHPLEDFEFDEHQLGTNLQVSTNQLQDMQPCPYCGNKGWAMCSSGHVHCCPDGELLTLTCPWCKTTDNYFRQTFNVDRGVG